MVGEKFEISLTQMAKIVFKSNMVGENVVIHLSQMVEIVFKSTMVGEIFEILKTSNDNAGHAGRGGHNVKFSFLVCG